MLESFLELKFLAESKGKEIIKNCITNPMVRENMVVGTLELDLGLIAKI